MILYAMVIIASLSGTDNTTDMEVIDGYTRKDLCDIAAEALNRSEQKVHLTATCVPSGIIEPEGDGNVVRWTPKA